MPLSLRAIDGIKDAAAEVKEVQAMGNSNNGSLLLSCAYRYGAKAMVALVVLGLGDKCHRRRPLPMIAISDQQ